MRRAHLLEHGGGGRRIGWGDDGAERDCGGPGQAGDAKPGHGGDSADGRRDRGHGKTHHRAPVPLQIAGRRVECRVEKHRRDEQGERELRVERHARHTGEERKARSCEREKRWVGDADVPRPRRKERASNEERDHQLEKRHDAPRCSAWRAPVCLTRRG